MIVVAIGVVMVWFAVVAQVESHIYADWLGWTFFVGWSVVWFGGWAIILWLLDR